jgi:hypothetical protein
MLAFFRWFCRSEYREDIEGDLLERFHYRNATYGAGSAKWSFLLDVLSFADQELFANHGMIHKIIFVI